jgi:hypothetical protein
MGCLGQLVLESTEVWFALLTLLLILRFIQADWSLGQLEIFLSVHLKLSHFLVLGILFSSLPC